MRESDIILLEAVVDAPVNLPRVPSTLHILHREMLVRVGC